jgi:hypothetical protein
MRHSVEEHPSDGEAESVGTEVATYREVAKAERTRAPLLYYSLYIRGERWSPGVYRSLRLLGVLSNSIAEEGFRPSSHFLMIISDY